MFTPNKLNFSGLLWSFPMIYETVVKVGHIYNTHIKGMNHTKHICIRIHPRGTAKGAE